MATVRRRFRMDGSYHEFARQKPSVVVKRSFVFAMARRKLNGTLIAVSDRLRAPIYSRCQLRTLTNLMNRSYVWDDDWIWLTFKHFEWVSDFFEILPYLPWRIDSCKSNWRMLNSNDSGKLISIHQLLWLLLIQNFLIQNNPLFFFSSSMTHRCNGHGRW